MHKKIKDSMKFTKEMKEPLPKALEHSNRERSVINL